MRHSDVNGSRMETGARCPAAGTACRARNSGVPQAQGNHDGNGPAIPRNRLKELLRRRIPRYLVSLPERTARAAAALVGGDALRDEQRGAAAGGAPIEALPGHDRPPAAHHDRVGRRRARRLRGRGDVGVRGAGGAQVHRQHRGVGQHLRRRLVAALAAGGRVRHHGRLEGVSAGAGGRVARRAGICRRTPTWPRTRICSGAWRRAPGVLADAIDMPADDGEGCPRLVRGAAAAGQRSAARPTSWPTIFREMQAAAQEEGRSLSDVSAALTLAAARAGVQTGQRPHFRLLPRGARGDPGGGLLRFLRRVATPYLVRAGRHFRPAGRDVHRSVSWTGWRPRRGDRATTGQPKRRKPA